MKMHSVCGSAIILENRCVNCGVVEESALCDAPTGVSVMSDLEMLKAMISKGIVGYATANGHDSHLGSMICVTIDGRFYFDRETGALLNRKPDKAT